MSLNNRRDFLKSSLAAAASITIAGTKSSGRVLGANDTIRIAVAGLNGRGGAHVGEFAKMQGVQITYLVDPDKRTYAKRLAQIGGASKPETVQDIRKALEDKNLDAVSIATPNHWHALMTIWACQAGKDVYVEKPSSHNVHEGRIAVEIARKHNRIVQHGTQSRSSDWGKMAEIAKSGRYGKLLVSRGLCYKAGGRGDIGFKQPGTPPAELDFNIWLGPAQEQAYHENLVHYKWHWFWDFGNGDIGNQGVHEMDKARWAIPNATLPKSVISLGGRIGYKDQGQTASSQVAIFDYGESQLIFEVRGLKSAAYMGQSIGNTLHFEEGAVVGGQFIPKKAGAKPEPLPKIDVKRGPGNGHFGNFIAAVRTRKVADLNADILEGHYSSALCHLANVSLRLGEETSFNPKTKAIADNREASETFQRMEEYLAKENGLKLDDWKYRVGRKLTLDAKTEKFVGDAMANQMLTREYRKPFNVPEKV